MFHKYNLTLFIAFLNIATLFSATNPQTDSLTVPIYSYFDKGESQRYVITQGKMRYKGETPTDSSESKQTITLTVVDSTTEGYVLEVFDEDFQNSAEGAKALDKVMEDAKMRALVMQYAHFRLRFQITPDGEFKGFENMDSLIQLTQIMTDFLKKDLGKDKRTQKVLTEMNKTLLSPEVIKGKLGAPFQLMFFYHGHEYMADTIVKYEEQLANNLEQGGKPIPTYGAVLFSYSETDSSYINVEKTSEPDEDVTTEAVLNWTKKISPKNEHASIDKMRVSIFDHLTMEIHQPTGWVTYLVNKRTTTTTISENEAEDSSNVDYIEIEIVPKSSEKEENHGKN
jgi:hypothetical protein